MAASRQPRIVEAIPHAASLIEGLRDFGYSLETSLADVIDNAITAGAVTVDIIAETASDEPWLAIVDNGHGMTEAELVEAMRPGSRNPRDLRKPSDLGRFGLGMKTASFAQCRNLTVLTRQSGRLTSASWDLDEVAIKNAWEIELDDEPSLPEGIELPPPHGTAVIWRKLDRLDGGYKHSRDERARTINSAISVAEDHLRLVFHRFLEGPKPRLILRLNGRPLKPIDPFASSHPATQFDPPDDLQLKQGLIAIRSCTLPHHKKMTEAEWKDVAGPEGHLKSQGLYIYRADRLIIAGGWLGLTAQTELTKLCRVRVDIPNTMDAEWKIDVKKASAQLPPIVRTRLKKVIERYVSTSRRTYQGRGRKLVETQRMPMWNRLQKDKSIVFRADLGHPVLQDFVDRLPKDLQSAFRNCINLLSASLPIESLHADLLGAAEAVVADDVDVPALRQQVEAMITTLLESKFASESIPELLKNNDLLNRNWAAVEPLIAEILDGKS